MLGDRLPLALDAMDAWGDGPVAVLHPPEDADLAAVPKDRVHVVSPLVMVCDRFERMGYSVSAELPKDTRFVASIVCLTRRPRRGAITRRSRNGSNRWLRGRRWSKDGWRRFYAEGAAETG